MAAWYLCDHEWVISSAQYVVAYNMTNEREAKHE